jgi:hypothetical protein
VAFVAGESHPCGVLLLGCFILFFMVLFSLRVLSTLSGEVVVVSSYFDMEIWILVLLFVVLSFGRVGFDDVHVFDCNSLCEKSCPSCAMGWCAGAR